MLSRIEAREIHLKEHTKNRARYVSRVVHTTLYSLRNLQMHPFIIILLGDIFRQLFHLKCPGITRTGYTELCGLVTLINRGRMEQYMLSILEARETFLKRKKEAR
jgi:hypothetical protein